MYLSVGDVPVMRDQVGVKFSDGEGVEVTFEDGKQAVMPMWLFYRLFRPKQTLAERSGEECRAEKPPFALDGEAVLAESLAMDVEVKTAAGLALIDYLRGDTEMPSKAFAATVDLYLGM